MVCAVLRLLFSDVFMTINVFVLGRGLTSGKAREFAGTRDISETVIFFSLKYALNLFSTLTILG